ncbi:hypothetical protein As57867_007389, partial [Aphanomyces stellatus]
MNTWECMAANASRQSQIARSTSKLPSGLSRANRKMAFFSPAPSRRCMWKGSQVKFARLPRQQTYHVTKYRKHRVKFPFEAVENVRRERYCDNLASTKRESFGQTAISRFSSSYTTKVAMAAASAAVHFDARSRRGRPVLRADILRDRGWGDVEVFWFGPSRRAVVCLSHCHLLPPRKFLVVQFARSTNMNLRIPIAVVALAVLVQAQDKCAVSPSDRKECSTPSGSKDNASAGLLLLPPPASKEPRCFFAGTPTPAPVLRIFHVHGLPRDILRPRRARRLTHSDHGHTHDKKGGGNFYGVRPFYVWRESQGAHLGVFFLNSYAMEVVAQKPSTKEGRRPVHELGRALNPALVLGAGLPPLPLALRIARRQDEGRRRPQDTQWTDIDDIFPQPRMVAWVHKLHVAVHIPIVDADIGNQVKDDLVFIDGVAMKAFMKDPSKTVKKTSSGLAWSTFPTYSTPTPPGTMYWADQVAKRNHNGAVQDQASVDFDPEAAAIIAKTIRHRYTFLPYQLFHAHVGGSAMAVRSRSSSPPTSA